MSSNAVMEESVHSWDFSFVISSRSRFAFLLSLPMGGAPPSASEHWTISSGLAIIICFQFSIYKNSSMHLHNIKSAKTSTTPIVIFKL
jgi:hypothetical protein